LLTGGLHRLTLFASLQQYLVKGLPAQVNVAYWSLTTEVHFYLLLPLLAALLARFGGRVLVPLGLAVALSWRFLAPGALPDSWIVGRIDQFVVGMTAAGLVAAADKGNPTRLVRMLLT